MLSTDSNSTVTYRLRDVVDPDRSLARAFLLPSQGVVYDAVRIVFDFFKDLQTNSNNRTDYAVAYSQSEAHLKHCLDLFMKYERDFCLNKFERDTALTAWLCQNCLDPTDPINWGGYDPKEREEFAVIDPDALSILAYLEFDNRWFPKLSHAQDDKPLAINIGLQILTRLETRTGLYRVPGQYEDRYLTPADDRHYAFSILTDHAPMNTLLARDCLNRAAILIEKLRNYPAAPHARPL